MSRLRRPCLKCSPASELGVETAMLRPRWFVGPYPAADYSSGSLSGSPRPPLRTHTASAAEELSTHSCQWRHNHLGEIATSPSILASMGRTTETIPASYPESRTSPRPDPSHVANNIQSTISSFLPARLNRKSVPRYNGTSSDIDESLTQLILDIQIMATAWIAFARRAARRSRSSQTRRNPHLATR